MCFDKFFYDMIIGVMAFASEIAFMIDNSKYLGLKPDYRSKKTY